MVFLAPENTHCLAFTFLIRAGVYQIWLVAAIRDPFGSLKVVVFSQIFSQIGPNLDPTPVAAPPTKVHLFHRRSLTGQECRGERVSTS